MNIFYTVGLLLISNLFMTFAWYGHLKFREWGILENKGLFTIILLSWLIAFFEYCFQVPANRIGFRENGGAFSLFELKLTQEVISIIVFIVIQQLLFKNEPLRWNHAIAFLFILGAVYFGYKK